MRRAIREATKGRRYQKHTYNRALAGKNVHQISRHANRHDEEEEKEEEWRRGRRRRRRRRTKSSNSSTKSNV